ncbi:MAG UNVERIFIED_CONTAM: ThiF family adenylyltransferase [Anaerolineae bacterium]
MAQSLAMSGVGQFVLVDDDVVEATNIVRHVAGLPYLGQPKVSAVRDLILQRNPHAQVESYHGRIEAQPELFDNLDVLVVGVDSERVKFQINDLARQKHLTAIYAGVYERGEGEMWLSFTPIEIHPAMRAGRATCGRACRSV